MALDLGTLTGFLDLETAKFDRKLDGAKGKFAGFAGKLGKVAAVGTAAAVAAVGAFAVTGVKQFATFEKGMNEVFTLLPGISDKAMGDMSEDTRKFVREMGVAHEEAVPALYSALSAGIPKDNVFTFMETAQKVAMGGVTDLDTAVNGLTGVINAYGEDAISADKASDLMFTTVKLGKTTIGELSSSLGDVTPLASSMGVSFDEVSAALATSTKITDNTAKSTTGLKGMLSELGKEGQGAAKEFERISGKSFPDFIKGGGDLQGALTLMEKDTKKTGGSMVDLFGSVEAGQAALQLTGSNTESFSGALDEMSKSAGATDAAFQTMDRGLSRSWDKIKIGVSDAAIGFGQELAPAVAGVADWFLGALPKAMETASFVLGEITGGIRAFAAAWKYNDGEITSSGFPGFMERLGYAARQTFDGLKTVGGWMVDHIGIIKGIAIAIGIGLIPVLIRSGVVALVSAAKQVAAWVMAKVGAIQTAAAYVASSYTIIAKWVAMGAAAIVSGAQTAYVWALYKIEAIKGAAAHAASGVRVAAAWVVMSAAAVVSGIKTAAVWTGTIIKQAAAGAVAFLVSAAKVVGGWVLMGVQSLFHAARMAAAWFIALGPIGWVIAGVVGLAALIIANWSKISEWTKKAWTTVSNKIRDVWKAIVKFGADAWTNIKSVFETIKTWVTVTVPGAFGVLKTKITEVWTGIKGFISDSWTNIKGTFNNVIGFLKDKLGPAFSWFKDKVIDPVWNGIKDIIDGVWKNGIKPVFDIIQQVLKGDFKGAFQTAKDAIDRIWKGVANVVRKPINFVIGTVYNQGIKKVFDKVAGIVGIKALPNASEIPAFAKGGQMGKGWKLVGEEGPELINTGPGFVHTAGETKKMLAGKQQAPLDSLGALSGPTPDKAALPNGGILSSLKGIWDKGLDWVRGGLAKAAEFVINPIKGALRGALGTEGFGGMVSGSATTLLDGALSFLRGKDKEEAADGGGFGGGGGGSFGGSYDGPMGRFHRPSRGPFTSMFGPRWGGMHAGVDIAGGGKTFAALNGIVKYIGKGGGLPGRTGLGIRLDHGGGFQTYYGHNPYGGVQVGVGEKVKAGQHIGYQGATGNVTGTHLHFETLRNGRAVNPMSYLYDKGGWLQPGENQVVANKSGKPEPIYTNAQNHALQTLAARGSNQPVNAVTGAKGNTYYWTVPDRATAQDLFQHAQFEERRLSRGGTRR